MKWLVLAVSIGIGAYLVPTADYRVMFGLWCAAMLGYAVELFSKDENDNEGRPQ